MLPSNSAVRIVVEDLRFLQREWGEQVDEASLRRGSTVLRRLLVQGELQRAWKAVGFSLEPEVIASTLRSTVEVVPVGTIRFAFAGGARYQGVEVRGGLDIPLDPEIEKRLDAQGVPQDRFKLKSFVEAHCMIVDGVGISRHRLIKYVANKLGGAHFDVSRDRSADGDAFRRLDYAARTYKFLGHDAVYFELLSTGQALVHADDVCRLCDEGERLILRG
jgi:hypothetical protein